MTTRLQDDVFFSWFFVCFICPGTCVGTFRVQAQRRQEHWRGSDCCVPQGRADRCLAVEEGTWLKLGRYRRYRWIWPNKNGKIVKLNMLKTNELRIRKTTLLAPWRHYINDTRYTWRNFCISWQVVSWHFYNQNEVCCNAAGFVLWRVATSG